MSALRYREGRHHGTFLVLFWDPFVPLGGGRPPTPQRGLAATSFPCISHSLALVSGAAARCRQGSFVSSLRFYEDWEQSEVWVETLTEVHLAGFLVKGCKEASCLGLKVECFYFEMLTVWNQIYSTSTLALNWSTQATCHLKDCN